MSLVSWFPLNGDIRDRVNGNIFSNASSAAFVENDKFGKSLYATGLTGFKYPAATNAEIFNNDYFSVSFWLYVPVESSDDNKNNMIIFGNDSTTASTDTVNDRKYSLFQYPTCNDLHLSWQNDDGTMYAGFVLYSVLPSYTWTHVCLTYDSSKGVFCYINGELKWSTTKSTAQTTANWKCDTYAFWQYRNRYLSDVRVYNHCLSVKEVKELSKGLLLKYSFDGLTTNKQINGLQNWSATSFSYDSSNNTYTITSKYGTDCSEIWGSGPCVKYLSVPYGYTYRVSADVYVTTDHTFQIDVNNGAASGSTWNGNDNDNTTLRKNSSLSVKAKTWTHVYWGSTNTNTNNTNQVAITCYDLLGLKCYNDTEAVTWYIKNFKFELSKNTFAEGFKPVISDTLIYDESGFDYNGTVMGSLYKSNDDIHNGTHWTGDFANAVYNKAFVPLQVFTYSAWIKSENTGSVGYEYIMGNGRDYGNNRGASIRVIHSNGTVNFDLGNGTTTLQLGSKSSVVDNKWHMVTGTYDGTTASLYLDGLLQNSGTLAGPLTWSDVANGTTGKSFVVGKMTHSYPSTNCFFAYTGDISDVRVYHTCFTAEDVLSLYQIRKSISKTGELFVNSIDESNVNSLKILSSGKQQAKTFNEIITLSDGSMWLQLQHHDMTGSLDDVANHKFTSGDAVRNTNIYLDENRWCCFPLIKTCDHGDNYEFMVIHQNNNNKALEQVRWSQTTSPYDSTFATTTHANITPIENVGSSYGGMYPGGNNNAWYFNNSINGNWYGCGCCYSDWSSGAVPSYNGVTVKYIQDVFIRIYSTNYSERKGDIIIAKEINNE